MRERRDVEPGPDEVFRSTPDIRGGVACFTGTRVGVSQLLGYLRDSYTIDEFLKDFPTVTKDQAQRTIERIDNEYVRGIERECAQEHDLGPDKAAEDDEHEPEGASPRASGRDGGIRGEGSGPA